jgi:lipoprotein-anchoring transpeptidase ErfK/SrfK
MHAGYLPGYPASHGCIRLPEEMALKFFEDAPVGTPVEIR